MPVETPPPIVQAYALFLLLGGFACFIHFFFLSKVSKKIAPEDGVPGWRLNFPDFLFGFFAILLLLMLVQMTLAKVVGIGAEEDVAARQIIIVGLGSHLAALGAVLAFYKTNPRKFQDPFDRRKLSWVKAACLGLYAFLAVLPIIYPSAYGWQFLLETIGQEPAPQETVVMFSQIEELPVLLLMVFLTVLVAPVTEEIIFRGCLYRFLKDKISMIPAMAVSGTLFGLLHQSLSTFLPLFLLGVALAYAYEKSGSIKVPILIHGIFNFSTVVIILLTMRSA